VRLPYALAGAGALLAAVAAGLWLTGVAPATSAGPPPPPPSLAAAPVAARPSPSPSSPPVPAEGALDPVVLELEHDASLTQAESEVREQWDGFGPLERTSFRTHLAQLRRVDLPVVLELAHPARRDTCYIALLRLEAETALLGTNGRRLRVPVGEVDRLWTRQAMFLWRDFDVLLGNAPKAASWAREALARDGFLYPGEDLATGVARYQRGADLLPDGVVGSRTLLSLYSLGRYARPRLAGAS
jgi:hypothetical protein